MEGMRVVILARSSSDFEAIRAECERRRLAYNAGLGDDFVFYRGQPDDQLTMSQHKGANVQPDMAAYFRQQVIVFLILLLVPAINLSSMTHSRLRQRVAEIGVRRSFGATRWQLLYKVQLPLALPTILTGVNQTIMMSLSMVVIAAMIAVGGLGEIVLKGITQMKIGLGFEGGIAVVILAIILDRITQGMAGRKNKN